MLSNSSPTTPATTSAISTSEFKPGIPSASALDEFQIRLVKMGGMSGPIELRARLDLSRQYAAEGTQWVALESAADFRPGQTIPSHRVEGWKPLPS